MNQRNVAAIAMALARYIEKNGAIDSVSVLNAAEHLASEGILNPVALTDDESWAIADRAFPQLVLRSECNYLIFRDELERIAKGETP